MWYINKFDVEVKSKIRTQNSRQTKTNENNETVQSANNHKPLCEMIEPRVILIDRKIYLYTFHQLVESSIEKQQQEQTHNTYMG